MSEGDHNGDWRCTECHNDFKTNDAKRRAAKLYCPECGSSDIVQVL